MPAKPTIADGKVSVGQRADAPGEREPLLVRACYGQQVERVPVWFMRQAGRSLPEYRKVRERASLLEICRRPELAAEVTLQPVNRLGVDAAVLFSDITLPLSAAGVGLEIVPGVGPVIAEPVRDQAAIERLPEFIPQEHAPYVADTVRLLRRELKVPLIGFAGGPFTLASYLVEGGPSKTYALTRQLMYGRPGLWRQLMSRMAEIAIRSLRSQIEAGAGAVQLFDSWAGVLDADSYAAHVLPATQRIFAALADLHVPGIHFSVGAGQLLSVFAQTGADVVGVDWRVGLDEARARVGEHVALQGNLDPALCLAPWDAIEPQVAHVIERAGAGGHVFNLGHGVLPETAPDTLQRVVDCVHRISRHD